MLLGNATPSSRTPLGPCWSGASELDAGMNLIPLPRPGHVSGPLTASSARANAPVAWRRNARGCGMIEELSNWLPKQACTTSYRTRPTPPHGW